MDFLQLVAPPPPPPRINQSSALSPLNYALIASPPRPTFVT